MAGDSSFAPRARRATGCVIERRRMDSEPIQGSRLPLPFPRSPSVYGPLKALTCAIRGAYRFTLKTIALLVPPAVVTLTKTMLSRLRSCPAASRCSREKPLVFSKILGMRRQTSLYGGEQW